MTDTAITRKATALLDYPEPAYPTDFKSWSRTSLERIATDAVIENRQLRSDLRAVLDAYRLLVAQQNTSSTTTV